MAVLLVLVTIALYWPATRCDFINFDDPAYVTENPHVQGGLNWEGVKWAFRNTDKAVIGRRSCGCPTCWTASCLV